MDLKQHIGSRLRAARLKQELTQEQLAEAVKKYPETISNIERGRVYVGLKLLEKLAASLDVPIAYFFEGAEAIKSVPRAKADQDDLLKRTLAKLSGSQISLAISLIEALAEHHSRNKKS